jgi:hypothetical protein
MAPIDIALRVGLVIVGFLITDRVLSRVFTGSWWKQPSDLGDDDG